MLFKINKYLVKICAIINFNSVYGLEEISFPKIWEMVVKNSYINKSLNLMIESSNSSVDRQSRYWLPSLYVNSQFMSTNDPTLTFINYLGEGQVKQEDFVPSTLNTPSYNSFNSTQIGLNFLLYDGSSRASYSKAQKHASKALEYKKNSELVNLYVKTLREYSNIINAENYLKELNETEKNVEKLINNYHIGEKSNPVGYSGLLSLKAIMNKINFLIHDINTNIKNSKVTLNLMAGNKNKEWKILNLPIEKFVSIYFNKSNSSPSSYQYLEQMEKSFSIKEKITAEKAKYLPKIGLFSQANIFGGDRGIKKSYIFGINITLNFMASDLGAASEVELLSQAKEEAAREIDLSEKIMSEISEENLRSINVKLDLTLNNEEILNEQLKVLSSLFKNGSTSVAQITEVYNKKTDILQNKYTLKKYLLDADLAKISLSQKNVEPKDIWSLK
ncbi:TolC family protein [Spirobacillus cienkowskii]|uniref:TolC family protein n=1 Tax=Spirobacillus cienkowskii TaxID=495820 RepID=UPI0030CBB388